jgi:hypothetical protein
VDPSVGLGRRREEKILDPTITRVLTSRSSFPVASRYTDRVIPAPAALRLRRIQFGRDYGPVARQTTN